MANTEKRNVGRVPDDLLDEAISLLAGRDGLGHRLALDQLRTRYASQLEGRAHAA